MSKKKLIIGLLILAVIFAFLGDCKMTCKVGNKDNGNSVSVPESQNQNSKIDL